MWKRYFRGVRTGLGLCCLSAGERERRRSLCAQRLRLPLGVFPAPADSHAQDRAVRRVPPPPHPTSEMQQRAPGARVNGGGGGGCSLGDLGARGGGGVLLSGSGGNERGRAPDLAVVVRRQAALHHPLGNQVSLQEVGHDLVHQWTPGHIRPPGLGRGDEGQRQLRTDHGPSPAPSSSRKSPLLPVQGTPGHQQRTVSTGRGTGAGHVRECHAGVGGGGGRQATRTWRMEMGQAKIPAVNWQQTGHWQGFHGQTHAVSQGHRGLNKLGSQNNVLRAIDMDKWCQSTVQTCVFAGVASNTASIRSSAVWRVMRSYVPLASGNDWEPEREAHGVGPHNWGLHCSRAF